MQTIKTDYSMDRLISQVLTFKPQRLVFPYGWCGHIPFAAWLMKLHQPGIFVELGTHSGNSYFSFCQAAAEYELSALCYAVDTWQGDEHSGEYGADVFGDVSSYNAQKYAGFSTLMRMRFDEALAYFSDGSIDLLHIDGLHTYEAVKADFESWLPKLSDRAIVLFHDINVRERDFGVWRLWEELSARYPHCSFHHSHGLGVLVVGAAVDLSTVGAIRACDAQHMRLLFNTAADAVLERHLRATTQQQLDAPVLDLESHRGRVHVLKVQLQEQATLAADTKIQHETQIADVQSQHEDRVANLQSQLEAAKTALTKTESFQRQAAQAQQHAAALNSTVIALKQSLSWRVTAPLRWLAFPLAALMRRTAVFRKSIELGGGVGKSAALLLQVLHDEGVQGVRWRLGQAEKLALVPGASGADFGASGAASVADPYQEWLRRYDPTDAAAMCALKSKLDALELKTQISIVMPVYNPPIDFLRQAIESAQAQVYVHWELCIADDASTDPAVRELLHQKSLEDKRIKVIYRPENGHISAASNSALEVATGEFIALMDHDDLLPPHALAHMALAIHDHPDVVLLYSDEDKIDTDNRRCDPYFKCEFNYELFLAQNMISHLGVYRRDVLEELGGFRMGVEGAQDWDLALRVLEKVGDQRIIHVPRVLYHWRVFPGSTALALEEKQYALDAQIRAISSHMERIGKAGTAVFPVAGVPGLLRVRYRVPENPPLISIIIPTKDRYLLIFKCISSILEKTTYKDFEIIIIDNDTKDRDALEYLEVLSSDCRIKIIRSAGSFNYSNLNNLGVSAARGDYVVLMNNDIEVITDDWIEEMLSFACQEDVGCVGARLWYPNGSLQHAGIVLGIGGVASHAHKGIPSGNFGYFGRASAHQAFSAVTAACLMVEKKKYLRVNGFDEKLAVAYNDVDFCLRIKECGYRNILNPFAEFIHHESASRGDDRGGANGVRLSQEGEIMKERWSRLIENDPFYSPNLTLSDDSFSMDGHQG